MAETLREHLQAIKRHAKAALELLDDDATPAGMPMPDDPPRNPPGGG